jgi:hypothetical protein
MEAINTPSVEELESLVFDNDGPAFTAVLQLLQGKMSSLLELVGRRWVYVDRLLSDEYDQILLALDTATARLMDEAMFLDIGILPGVKAVIGIPDGADGWLGMFVINDKSDLCTRSGPITLDLVESQVLKLVADRFYYNSTESDGELHVCRTASDPDSADEVYSLLRVEQYSCQKCSSLVD